MGLCATTAPALADVPVTMAYGYPMVPVEIGGLRHLFVIDTGAEGSAVYPDFASRMSLPHSGAEKLVGQTGDAQLPMRTISVMSFDGHPVGPIAATELPARHDRLPLSGIVGLDVIRASLLDLDFPNGRAALIDRPRAGATTRRLGQPVKARRLSEGLLGVPVVLDGVTGWGVIDTGARETRVNTAFARSARLVWDDERPAASVSGATQNKLTVAAARVQKATFLGRDRNATTVGVVDLPVFAAFGLDGEPAMLLGIDWLSRHRLVIDFHHALVWSR